VVARLNKEIKAAVNDPATRKKLQGLGLDPVGSSQEEFSKFLHAEMARWETLVKSNRISVD
jgi:tripartite-type tricarboxylate transporter receptor subunit TctC